MLSATSSAIGTKTKPEEAGTRAASGEEATSSLLFAKPFTQVIANFCLASSLSANFLIAVSVPSDLLSFDAYGVTIWASAFVCPISATTTGATN